VFHDRAAATGNARSPILDHLGRRPTMGMGPSDAV